MQDTGMSGATKPPSHQVKEHATVVTLRSHADCKSVRRVYRRLVGQGLLDVTGIVDSYLTWPAFCIFWRQSVASMSLPNSERQGSESLLFTQPLQAGLLVGFHVPDRAT